MNLNLYTSVLILLVTLLSCEASERRSGMKSVNESLAVSKAEQKTITYNIVQYLVSEPSMTSFLAGVKSTKLLGVLSGKGPYTVFVPTNTAFAALPEKVLSELFYQDLEGLKALITYHVVPGAWDLPDMLDGQKKLTLNGGLIHCSREQGPQINGVDIIQSSIQTKNGIIHLIDEILLPIE